MKLFYFDLETTGVKFWKNGIHQISGMIEVDGIVKEEFNYLVRPFERAIIEPDAMLIGKVTSEQICLYPSMSEVYNKLIALLSKYVDKWNKKDKYYTVGYNNASFDNAFLRAWFVQNNDNYYGSWFWSCPIDVMVLAGQHLIDKREKMNDFKLMSVAKEMGIAIDEKKLHEASYDIYLTRSIYKLITQIK